VDCSETIQAIHLNAPWYQRSTGGLQNDRQAIYDSEEGTHNRSFDYYQRDILHGTNVETRRTDAGEIEFLKKRIDDE
jgi:hypothetical protein